MADNRFFSDSKSMSSTMSCSLIPTNPDLASPDTKSEPEVKSLRTKVAITGSDNNASSSQKVVIDVKNETPTPPVANSRKKKSSLEKRVKREISLVLEPTPKKCSGYVGFANLPNQVYR